MAHKERKQCLPIQQTEETKAFPLTFPFTTKAKYL